MKRILITVILCFAGMTVFAQNMSYYTNDYMRPDGSYAERLRVLETVRDSGTTGIGEFYHDAIKYLLLRAPNIEKTDQDAAEKSAVILCQGLGAEEYTAAALELWHIAELFDVVKNTTIDGNAMQAALIAIGQVNAKDFLPQIVLRLDGYNAQTFRNAEARRRVQMAVTGCINAIEALKDISGYRPVFFTYIGSYDPAVKQIAFNALPNIVEDPGEVISAIIQHPSNDPRVKLTAWNEMLRSKAPASSKASVAAIAYSMGWSYATSNKSLQENLRDMRKSAIDTIREVGVSEASVYANLEKSYITNLNNNQPDYDEIMLTLNALAALKSDEAVGLLNKFLGELHDRRQRNVWGDKERRIFSWVISCIGATKTNSQDSLLLLNTIQRTSSYTPYEQGLARDTLKQLQ